LICGIVAIVIVFVIIERT